MLSEFPCFIAAKLQQPSTTNCGRLQTRESIHDITAFTPCHWGRHNAGPVEIIHP
jgi:hypothetical protein